MSPLFASEKERTAAWASLMLRIAMASLFITTSVAKLSGGLGQLEGLIGMYQTSFRQTWLPTYVVMVHLYLTPFIEAILPLWLLVGVRLKAAWVVTSIYLITLAFGKAVVQDLATASQNYTYVLIAVIGLYLSAYDRFNLQPRRRAAVPAGAASERAPRPEFEEQTA